MMHAPTVAFRTLVFVVLVCASLIVVDGWRSWSARSVHLNEMEVAAANLATAMASQAAHTIEEADFALVGMVERVQFDGISVRSLARLHGVLATDVTEEPQLDGLFVYDNTGKPIASSQATLRQNYNNSDREYFIYHRTHGDPTAHISFPVKSRSTGKWIVPVSRRINDAEGKFAGVALATIDIQFFSKFYDSLDIGRDGAVGMFSTKGFIIVRRPFSESFIGKGISDTPLFHAYTSNGPIGTTFITSTLDHVVRLNSYRQVTGYPLFVTAALSKEEILASWRRDALIHAGGVLFLVALLGYSGWGLVKQIKRRTDAEEEVIRAHHVLRDLNKTLEQLAMHDGLTGLANRRHFDEILAHEFNRAMRQRSMLALIMLDVDYFKQYNDIYGHAAGDACLRAISYAILHSVPGRPADLAARYGGEEIAIVLPETEGAGAAAVAETIRMAICDLKITHVGAPLGYVTLSAGVESVIPKSGVDEPTMLIQAADKALYKAKAGGRNQVCLSQR